MLCSDLLGLIAPFVPLKLLILSFAAVQPVHPGDFDSPYFGGPREAVEIILLPNSRNSA
jgi:hypothetical protein